MKTAGGYLMVALTIFGSALLAGPAISTAEPPAPAPALTIGNHGPRCQRIRATSPAINEPKGNDMVVYCPVDFPWIMHCSTIGAEAPLDKTDISGGKTNCATTGKCSALGLRNNTGPQNQALEIVQKAASSVPGLSITVTGCWVYDLDHAHLPYTTEVICCR